MDKQKINILRSSLNSMLITLDVLERQTDAKNINLIAGAMEMQLQDAIKCNEQIKVFSVSNVNPIFQQFLNHMV